MNALLLPALLSALLTMILCQIEVTRRRRPSLWLIPIATIAIGTVFTLESFGLAFFTLQFWTANPVFDPVIAGVLFVFGLFASSGLVPALTVVLLYRISLIGVRM